MRLTIFQRDNWREIAATLSRNKTRTFLTAFGIFWGTAMLALLTGGADGFKGIMSRQFAGFATNMGVVFPGQRSEPCMGFNRGTSWSLTAEDIANIRRVSPAIEASSAVIGTRVDAVYGSKSKSAQCIGVEPSYTHIIEPVLYGGRFVNDADMEHSRKVAVIGRNLASDLFGTDSAVGKRVSLNGVYYLIIGVAGQKGDASIAGRIDDSFIAPLSTVQRSFNMGDNYGFFTYVAPKGRRPSDNQAAIRRYLERRHAIAPGDEQAIGFMDVSEMFDMVDGLFTGISLLAFFVGLGSLMAGVIGVGNIMWIVVRERTHEFGVRRAIGAKPLDITMQVLSESILLTLVAGTAGVCFAALILGIADTVTADPMLGTAGFEISFGGAMGVLWAFFIAGTAAGTLPAIKAMKIKPIEALRDK